MKDYNDVYSQTFVISMMCRAFKSGFDAGKEHKEQQLFSKGYTAGWAKGGELGKEVSYTVDYVQCIITLDLISY